MTEEQIKQNAERFASVYYHPYDSENNPQYLTVSEDSFIAGAHSRDEEIEQLKSEKSVLKRLLNEMEKRAIKAENECDVLKDKVTQYEDWNNRLQEFMDMSEEDRLAYVENLKKTNELNRAIERFGFYGKMLSRVFI